MKFYILTFGCKVNQCESESICESMAENGFALCESYEQADIVIINSCTVTAESDRKLHQTVNKIRKNNQNCILVLAGCMPQASPEAAAKIPGIDIVLGNTDKNSIPTKIKNFLIKNHTILENKIQKSEPVSFISLSGRTRAFLKIEDGCNQFCSYCIIPFARGRVRSKPLEEIKSEIEKLALQGYKEVVLVGINLSCYGIDIGCSLVDAVKTVCSITGIERVRLGSLEPELLTDEIIYNLSLESKLCPQFHLSLQSGCDEILNRMRRKYTAEEYLKIVANIRKFFKNSTITTDLMVGFPGESEENFQESLNLIEKVQFLKVHVFPYSKRPGTLAADMPNQIRKSIKSERVKKVIEISNQITNKVLNGFVGQKMAVLYETIDENGFYEGYTPNYIFVKSMYNKNICGKILNIRIEKACENFCLGGISNVNTTR